MDIKAAKAKKEIKVGSEVIVINGVKGDDTLYRVVINQCFKGYIQKRDGEYHRIDGSSIHDLIFARICHFMQN